MKTNSHFKRASTEETGLALLTLVTSAGTLVCCALPILLVSLGLGTAVASLTSSFPLLISMSQHKEWIFGGSLLVLIVSGRVLSRSNRRCPADQQLARACARMNRVNRWIWRSAIAIWVLGFCAAFLFLPLTRWASG